MSRTITCAVLCCAVLMAGCGQDGGDDVSDSARDTPPASDSTTQPRQDGTSDLTQDGAESANDRDTPTSESLSFTFTDKQGYTFDAEIWDIEFSTAIENAEPGFTQLSVDSGDGRITNTTPGRTAPAVGLGIMIAIPQQGYCMNPGVFCADGFLFATPGKLWNPDSYGGDTPSVPAGDSFELSLDNQFPRDIPDTVSLNNGYWYTFVGPNIINGSPPERFWVPAGEVQGNPPPGRGVSPS